MIDTSQYAPENAPIPDDYGLLRVPPHNLEAEVCVIGALIQWPALALPATKIVCAEDFYRPAHAIVYGVLLEMFDRGAPIDMVTLREALLQRDQLKAVGGIEYIVAMCEGVPSGHNAEYYATIVRQKSVLRRIILCGTETAQMAYDRTADVEEILGTAQGELYELDQRLHGGVGSGGTLGDVGRDDIERFEAIAAGLPDPAPPLPTGFADLDNHMAGGLRPGDVIVIGAGASVGKSSLALNIVKRVCPLKRGPGARVLFVSAEMLKREIWRRLAAMCTGVRHRHMRVGAVSPDELSVLRKAVAGISRWKLAVEDRAMTIQAIGVEARRRGVLWGGLDLIVIDYLQRMNLGSGKESRQEKLEAFSCGVKGLAMSLQVPVILLSQINREGKKAERPPNMGDLLGSGATENDADYVLMMYQTMPERDDTFISRTRGYGRVQVKFDKGRGAGQTEWGAIHLIWKPWIFGFENDELVREGV